MYKYRLMTLTQLGSLFGTTSHQVGKWLVQIGLRTTNGKPSQEAFKGKFCETTPSHGQGYHWAWVVDRTVAALERAGHQRVSPPPLDLVEPPPLLGPFQARTSEKGQTEIVGADGHVSVIVSGERNAKIVVGLLNLAHRVGKLRGSQTGETQQAI